MLRVLSQLNNYNNCIEHIHRLRVIFPRMIIILDVSFNMKMSKSCKGMFLLANPIYNPTMLPTSGQYYDDQTYDNYSPTLRTYVNG